MNTFKNKTHALTFSHSKKLREMASQALKGSSLVLVKDEGIYLMSRDKKNKGLHIYARGYNPTTNDNWWDKASRVSSDDFGETIKLTKEWLNKIINNRGALTIRMSDDDIQLDLICNK